MPATNLPRSKDLESKKTRGLLLLFQLLLLLFVFDRKTQFRQRSEPCLLSTPLSLLRILCSCAVGTTTQAQRDAQRAFSLFPSSSSSSAARKRVWRGPLQDRSFRCEALSASFNKHVEDCVLSLDPVRFHCNPAQTCASPCACSASACQLQRASGVGPCGCQRRTCSQLAAPALAVL